MEDGETIRILRRSAMQHDHGIICLAMMWGAVVSALEGADAGRVMGLAPPECQAAFRRIYRERPWSLQGEGRDESSRQVVEAIEVWCLAPEAKHGAAN
jgi:hypothetical protein